jgi:hypothetical protein
VACLKTVSGWLVVAALVVLPLVWFEHLAADRSFTCKPAEVMADAIDARMRDGRVHVVNARTAYETEAFGGYGHLFVTSAKVRAAGVYVGIGTWASNSPRLAIWDQRFVGWSRMGRYESLVPVNKLARTLSAPFGVVRGRDLSRLAELSQRCVRSP